jgi:serine/threonine protein kinase
MSLDGDGSVTAALPKAPISEPSMRTGARPFHLVRSRHYAFSLDNLGQPIEIGSGRFAKVFLGAERWMESLTNRRRPVVIKMLQKGVAKSDAQRFQIEKELLERVQGHPGIVELLASGICEDVEQLPAIVRNTCEASFMILERMDMSLEERLKGSRSPNAREDLLALSMRDRLLRVLEYMLPIAGAVEYAHVLRNVCHRDIKPGNILIGLPHPKLAGSGVQVRLADFNIAKLNEDAGGNQMTRLTHGVPGTLYFQSPEQEMNLLEILVNVEQGATEVEYFEDFYIDVGKGDTFAVFNQPGRYEVVSTDRKRRRIVLATPYTAPSETNIRARVQHAVGRPADIYSLGALFYYLITGTFGNPKTLYDTFHKFIEYAGQGEETNTIESFLDHEYTTIRSLRKDSQGTKSDDMAPADRFFTYKHYMDRNGELVDQEVMFVIARCMIRNKKDSYCQAHDLDTEGITQLVKDLQGLYGLYGIASDVVSTRAPVRMEARREARAAGRGKSAGDAVRDMMDRVVSFIRPKK